MQARNIFYFFFLITFFGIVLRITSFNGASTQQEAMDQIINNYSKRQNQLLERMEIFFAHQDNMQETEKKLIKNQEISEEILDNFLEQILFKFSEKMQKKDR